MSDDLLKEIRSANLSSKARVIEFFKQNKIGDAAMLDKISQSSSLEVLSEHYPYECKIGRKEYEEQKTSLQIELLKLQSCLKKYDGRIAVLFEGRDAAGKGGAIKRMIEHLNPRGARIVALDKPSELEKTQWYFQRYLSELPSGGELVLFDRSWYNRAGVERVMSFCSQEEYDLFLSHVPSLEQMLIDSGLGLHKFWFSVSQEEQLRRFIARIVDPLKRWKISPMDLASIGRWDEYTAAKKEMFKHTDTEKSPWIVVRSDDKKRARLEVFKYILRHSSYNDKDESKISGVDSGLIGRFNDVYDEDEL